MFVQKVGKIICDCRNGFKPIFLCTPATTTITAAVVFIKYLKRLRHYILEGDSLIDHPIVTNITAVETPIPSHDILYAFWCNIFLPTLIKCLALFRSPSVVCLELSAPTGTMSFNFSRQWRRWARRFFSSSLWVDLKFR